MTPDRVRHVKRGTYYEVVERSAELQCTGMIGEGCRITIYRGDDGKLWARPFSEFHDGRFVSVPEKEGRR